MESLRTYSPECEIIVIRADGSFAENCNRGIAASTGDYICLLNDDCIVTEGWLSPLIQILDEHPKAGAVSPMMLFPEGRVQFGGMIFHNDYSAGHLGWGWKHDDPRLLKEPTEFQATTFGCVLLRRSALEHIAFEDIGFASELIDEFYKIGGYEDIDCCFRMKLNGWQIWYQPNSKIFHYENATFMSMPYDIRWKASIQNRKLFFDRWTKYFDNKTFKVDDKDYEGGEVNCYLCKHSVNSHEESGFCRECDCKRFKVGWDN
jgi:GT2 family glycosyltransferase